MLDFLSMLLILFFGIGIAILMVGIRVDIHKLIEQMYNNYSHIRYYQNREKFNTIGIEIVNGSTIGDKIYLIMRSGTFGGEFFDTVSNFRSHKNTRLVVITPDREIFLSNCNSDLKELITDFYENDRCEGVRGMLLYPSENSTKRMKGYIFISDGHVHAEDDGFYTNTVYSARFLRDYMNMLIDTGREMTL